MIKKLVFLILIIVLSFSLFVFSSSAAFGSDNYISDRDPMFTYSARTIQYGGYWEPGTISRIGFGNTVSFKCYGSFVDLLFSSGEHEGTVIIYINNIHSIVHPSLSSGLVHIDLSQYSTEIYPANITIVSDTQYVIDSGRQYSAYVYFQGIDTDILDPLPDFTFYVLLIGVLFIVFLFVLELFKFIYWRLVKNADH